MHPYATDSDETKTIPLYLAALAVAGAFFSHVALDKIHVTLPWWIDGPSVVAFYSIFYWLFDTWLWKKPVFTRLGIVSVPDLSGVWHGEVASSFDGHEKRVGAELEITQTWRQTSIRLRTGSSESHSVLACIIIAEPGAAILEYEYCNEPKTDARHTMHAHRGMARLILAKTSGDWVLEGDYYTGRDRRNIGALHFQRSNQSSKRER